MINPIHPPRLYGASLGRATFKASPTDFQVEEILGFAPSGTGEHCLLWVEKTDRNSNDVATHFAQRLGIRRRLISHCGLKDKHAVTRQWFNLHLPGQESPPKERLEAEGIRILKITRNLRKLHRGSHDGNRFHIRLRDCQCHQAEIEERWRKIITSGVPNYFGPQRFGHRGDNIRQARELLTGNLEIRDRNLRGILISAARGYLFNLAVATRVINQTWSIPQHGEVFGFASNRSLILPGNHRGDEHDRVSAGTLELTAPLWGNGQLISEHEVQSREQQIATQEPELSQGLSKLGLKQERRVIRLTPQNTSLSWPTSTEICLSFDLPKGTYATTILRELLDLIEL